jgi:hypothetical protein
MSRHTTTVRRRETYSKPSSAVGQYFWRWKMWVDSTFVLGMLEPWERFLVGKYLLRVVFCGHYSQDFITPQSRSFSWSLAYSSPVLLPTYLTT